MIASCPGSIISRERAGGTHWTEGSVSRRVGLVAVEVRNLSPGGNRTPAIHPVAHHYTNRAMLIENASEFKHEITFNLLDRS